jgi:hypothetical protein
MRRCARCRLLFEADEAALHCIACGEPVLGLALPLTQDSAPVEIHDGADTDRVPARRKN